MKLSFLACIIIAFTGPCFAAAAETDAATAAATNAAVGTISLKDILHAAENANHYLAAAQSQEIVAQKQVNIAEGDFLPHLEADVLDTSGFTGSSSLIGLSGLTGASHTGYATGLVASTTLWDFGRTLNKVHEMSHLSLAQKAQTSLTREDVDAQAARLYFECARFQSQVDTWTFILAQAQIVTKEVERFVQTGQRSIVDRYLSRAQTEQALTNRASYSKDLRLARQRLEVYTRLPIGQIRCPLLRDIEPIAGTSGKINPLIRRADENELAAEARVNYAKDDFLPRLKAFAAVGKINNVQNDYAAGVGLSLPLFDGLKTVNQIDSAEADLQSREELIEAAHDDIDETNARYDQIIKAAKVRLVHLNDELSLANSGFTVAKNRYFSFRGTLIDLREALSNLMRIRTEVIDIRAGYMLAVTEKKIFNDQVNSTK